MKTQTTTTYFVNGEIQHSEEDELTVRQILEHAGFTPPEEYKLERDHGHHVYPSLDDVVELHRDERFTALFQGVTQTS